MPFKSSLSQLAWWKTYFTPRRYNHNKISDLTGKVAIVTGANTGLGYASTVALAANGARVFLACRNRERAEKAIEDAKMEIKSKLDLSDMTKSHQAAPEFLKKGLPLHILVNNSGITNCPFELSVDGVETQFAVNHMGHFVFTMDLLARIKESQPSRIVILSSLAHEQTPTSMNGIDFDTLNNENGYSSMDRYDRSKLANVLFGKALARQMSGEKEWVNIAHPGAVSTELSRGSKDIYGDLAAKFISVFISVVGMSPRTGALTQLYLAASPEIIEKDIRGRYFIPIANKIQSTQYSRDENLQEKLWAFSENLAKEKIRT